MSSTQIWICMYVSIGPQCIVVHPPEFLVNGNYTFTTELFHILNLICFIDIGSKLKIHFKYRIFSWKFERVCTCDRNGQSTSKKVYYIQYTDTHRFLLKTYNIHPAKKVFEHLRYFVSKNLY